MANLIRLKRGRVFCLTQQIEGQLHEAESFPTRVDLYKWKSKRSNYMEWETGTEGTKLGIPLCVFFSSSAPELSQVPYITTPL